MDALQERKRKLAAVLAENMREARQLKQRAKDGERGKAKAWKLSSFLQNAVLIIYTLTGCATEPVVTFLANNAKMRHWPEKSEEELISMLDELSHAVDVAQLAALTDLAAPTDEAAMKAALVYVEQWRLADWTRGLNAGPGVAPSTQSVLMHLEQQRGQLPEAVRPKPLGTTSDASARVWATAWRRRWGGKHGRIQIRDDVPQAELVRKVLRIRNFLFNRNRAQRHRNWSKF